MSFRIGIGYDIHRLVVGRKLILAGVIIDYPRGLLGHSDADVIAHAVCDAMLGAVARGDIGALFPDTTPETKDMNSIDMLKQIVQMIEKEYMIANIDINCICERPKLSFYREKMVAVLAEACKIDTACISIKFRTNEGLGEVGSGDAIASQAVVLLEKAE